MLISFINRPPVISLSSSQLVFQRNSKFPSPSCNQRLCSTPPRPNFINPYHQPPRTSLSAHAFTMPTNDYQCYLDVAIDAAKAAGQVITQAWNKPRKVEHKGAVDLVTETDKQCESLVLSIIQAAYPDHRFIGEEGSAAQGFTDQLTDSPTWMCDPVDGTTNFVHQFPFSCVSIGLCINKKVVAGVVYNPILNELFHATLGGGAFLNGTQIHTSDTTDLGHAVVATELGTRRDEAFLDACFTRMKNVSSKARSLRCCGSCALNLCGVAMGRLDAYYEVGLGGCWDLAAATLIVKEAGGEVLDPVGGEFNIMSRRVLGANSSSLGGTVADILKQGPWAPDEPPVIPLV